jgi:putative MFS transporter
VGYASPLLVAQWGLSSTEIGLLSTATFGAMAVGSIVTGAAGDIYGRKRVFIVMLAIYSFGSLLAAFAPDYQSLILARILIGLGLGGEISLGFTVV